MSIPERLACYAVASFSIFIVCTIFQSILGPMAIIIIIGAIAFYYIRGKK